MDVPVLDHFIIGNGDYKSIREKTTIWSEITSLKDVAQRPSIASDRTAFRQIAPISDCDEIALSTHLH
jgi:hypothetical protein